MVFLFVVFLCVLVFFLVLVTFQFPFLAGWGFYLGWELGFALVVKRLFLRFPFLFCGGFSFVGVVVAGWLSPLCVAFPAAFSLFSSLFDADILFLLGFFHSCVGSAR
ncbi:hypothetical protein [Paenibacillus algorifonticola]|uniref:hypothetical protein n=1 Tax=Paenibacillus algorifonticola TaxID=684063 RepID=UPI001C43154A|nr:hypothetical protein [Paenibacillus algorifonticola]